MCALSVTLDQYFFMRTGKTLISLHGFGMLIWVCAVLACYFIDFTVPWLVPKCVYNGAMRKHEKTCLCHMRTTRAQISCASAQSDQRHCCSLPR